MKTWEGVRLGNNFADFVSPAEVLGLTEDGVHIMPPGVLPLTIAQRRAIQSAYVSMLRRMQAELEADPSLNHKKSPKEDI